MEKDINHNPELQLAFDFVQFTGNHIFLTGRAGTGKTTFLHDLKQLSPKRMIVVAPTGVAAINAGGVTIHSFFQLPFGPKVPGYSENQVQKGMRFSTQKRNIIKSLDLLVIDEISMVRADLLDGIDEVMQRFRRNKLPFGGVQLLMIGDMQQLPPVVKDNEWNLLRKYYETAFFFSSLALLKTNYITITLQYVYRQRDQHFVEILNKVRDKQMDQQTIELLNKRYLPNFDAGDENYIILTTHNVKAKAINDKKLARLKTNNERFKAEVSGNFPEYIYPTEINLELKKGAQVMFVKNDPDIEKRFFNGKIGTIIELSDSKVIVQCPEDDDSIIVTPIEWQNIKYSIEEHSKEIRERVEGTFTQIPLKLAWAITIHKSQGLTFEKAIIDSESAFAHGQVYVALSRCRTLEGMVLSTPFSPDSLKNNKSIEGFNELVGKNQPDQEKLEVSKAEFQQKLLNDLFIFSQLQNEAKWFFKLLFDSKSIVQQDVVLSIKTMNEQVDKCIVLVSEKFRNQINTFLQENNNTEQNIELQERIKKASIYFSDKIQRLILSVLKGFSIETDNKEIKKKIGKAEGRLLEEAKYKMECLKSCNNGFFVKDYLKDKAKASMEIPSKKTTAKGGKLPVSKDVSNPDLYGFLREWRDAKALELEVPHYMVLPLKAMRALSNQVPASSDELKMVHGFGKKKLENFGEEILDLLKNYRKDHNLKIERPELPLKATKKPKGASKQISFELWLEHKDVEKVAKTRDLAVSTIFGHLSFFISSGELSVHDFIKKEKLETISSFLKKNPDMPLGEAKQKFDDSYTYNDLRFVQQHLMFLGETDKK